MSLKNKQARFLGWVLHLLTLLVCNQHEAVSLPGAASSSMQLGATESSATLLSFLLASLQHLCTHVKAQ